MTPRTHPPPARPERVRVLVRSPETVVRTGLTALLTGHVGIEVLGPSCRGDERPDVVVYDVLALLEDGGRELAWLVRHSGAAVVAADRSLRPDLAARARALGAHTVVPLTASSSELAGAVRAAVAAAAAPRPVPAAPTEQHLGADHGLTRRESDVLAGVARGLSNLEVAAEMHLSINSVKTYIRQAYRKIGATTRAQAVAWAILHGFSGREDARTTLTSAGRAPSSSVTSASPSR